MGTEQSKPRTSSCKSINYEIINGSILFTNGDKYVGDVQDGQLNGNGTYYFNNRDVYKGEWRCNKKHGFGIQTYARENRKYVGFWQDNLPHGEGTLYNPDGSYFEGHFLEGEKHGNGVFHDAQNDAYEEEWVYGELTGRAPLSPSKLKSSNTPNNLSASKRESKENNSKPNLGMHETSIIKSLAKSDASDHKFESSEGFSEDRKPGSRDKDFDKNVHSNILFKSLNEFDSSDGRMYEVGLETLNIIEHIEMLNSVAGNLLNKDVQDWSYQEVSDWLRHLGLTDYIETFKQNHIDGEVLFDITEADLKDEFGMTSVGHRKNFMKAIDNLKKMFNSETGKNSEYIQHKIQRFYERNRPNNGRALLSNSLRHPQPTRFYSTRMPKNLYSSQQDIIDEGDEHNSRSDMKPSPPMYGKKSPFEVAKEDFGLNETKPGSPQPRKLDHDADDESHVKSLEERDDIRQDLPPKVHLSKKTLSKISSDSQKSSPVREDHGVKNDFEPIEEFKSSHSKKNDKESTNSHDGSSSDTTSESESDEEKGGNKEEKPKEDAEANLRPPKRNSKNDKKKKTNIQNFKSAELPIILKPSPKKSAVENKNTGRRRHNRDDKETLNEKIKDEILRIFKDSGLNENFIIDYNELSFGKKIGEGGYGRVFLGKFSGIEVAIKEYGKTKLDVRRAEDFVKEVEVISNLRHPNIVLCMGACIHNGKYLMITEYLEEGSLFDHLHEKHTKLSDEIMLGIIEDIALGMCYLHGRKVFHCDLKSSNILIDSSWEVKLCDFGLSRVKYKSDRKRFQKQRVGTPHWMAPEILRGEKYDEAADVYSFGMILWEIITGEIPYHKVPISDIIATIGYEGKQINLPSKGNPLMLSIMKSCLSLDKTARPTFKQIVDGLQQRNKNTSNSSKKNLFNFFGPN